MIIDASYLKLLKDRSGKSKAYSKHQFLGAEIGEILGDPKHTALYIKLAKESSQPEVLLQKAKHVGGLAHVKNKGAYFMRMVTSENSSKK